MQSAAERIFVPADREDVVRRAVFSRLVVPDDGYDSVVSFAMFGQDRRLVP